MTEAARLQFELSEMAAPTFEIERCDLQYMVQKMTGWYDCCEYEGNSEYHHTHEFLHNWMRSGLFLPLLPRQWRVIFKGTGTTCKRCKVTLTSDYLVLQGTNQLGVTYTMHVGVALAEQMVKGKYITEQDWHTSEGLCIDCAMS